MGLLESVQAGRAHLDGASALIILGLTNPGPLAGPQAALAIPPLNSAADEYQKAFADPGISASTLKIVAQLRDDARARVTELAITSVIPWPFVYSPLGAISAAVQRMCAQAQQLVDMVAPPPSRAASAPTSHSLGAALHARPPDFLQFGAASESQRRLNQIASHHIATLAEREPSLYASLTTDPTKAIKELGVAEGVRYVVVSPGDRVLFLTRYGSRDKGGSPGEAVTGSSTKELHADNAGWHVLGQHEIHHYNTNIIPIGHRGDDILFTRVPSGAEIVDVTLVNTDALAGSEAKLMGWRLEQKRIGERDVPVVAADIHWWFNGWQDVKFSLKVWVNDPTGAFPPYEAVFGEFNTMGNPVNLDWAPNYRIETTWDNPNM